VKSCGCQIVENNDDGIEFHTLPHGPWALKIQFAEVVDLIGDVVSPEGIEPARPSPKGEGRVTDDVRASHIEPWRDVVSPEGIEPSTNRLRVCCSAS
jgi:hypothetical protein